MSNQLSSIDEIKIVYARIKGIEQAIAQIGANGAVRSPIGKDISACAKALSKATGVNFSELTIPDKYYYMVPQWGWIVSRQLAESKVAQIINIIEQVYHYSDPSLEAGTAYNFIKDTILKSRCADLLSADKHFDRVINQATLVFEDRLREICGLGNLSADDLINQAIGAKPEKIIRFSEDVNVHSGYYFMCRGIISAFRNPTHHEVIDSITREEALKICGFIDTMLSVLNTCNIHREE